MSNTYEQLWDKEIVKAENQSFKNMLLHSGSVRKNKKPGLTIKNSRTLLFNIIPTPCVGTHLNIALYKAIIPSKNVNHFYQDEVSQDFKKQVKHGTKKKLDKLEKTSVKAISALIDLNKLVWFRGNFISIHLELFKFSSALHDLCQRIRTSRIHANIKIQMRQAPTLWCEQVEYSLINKKVS